MLARLTLFFGWLALLAGLTLPTLAPGTANITTLVLMGTGLVVVLADLASRLVWRDPGVRMVLLAGAILLVALVPTARSPLHLIAIMILAPLWLIAPHGALLQRLGGRLRPIVIGAFALVGTAAGSAISAIDVLFFGQERGGWLVNNPIHLADLSLMLGFVALVGATESTRFRLLFLLGPMLALVTIWFSGSRGPLLAFVPMLLLGGGMLGLLLLPLRKAGAALGAVVVLVGLIGFGAVTTGAAGRLGSVSEIGALLSGTSADSSTNERLDMLESAASAFAGSPFYGYGLLDYTSVAQGFVPAAKNYGPWGHLHNDTADFAVIGGLLGLLCYALILLAPLVSGLRNRGRWRKATIYLGVVTPVGYLSMGLTNAMFGILAQTTLYAVILSLQATLSLQSKEHTA